MIRYSFIIPVKKVNDYVRESVSEILKIPRDDYEIIVCPDELDQADAIWAKTRFIQSGPGGPALKRSLSARNAAGSILVFIDDDAYPERDFLDVLDADFANEEIVAIGGPAVTPASDGFWERVSGAVFLSPLAGGFPERYVPRGSKRWVDDWPSVNLSVRKAAFVDVGGFDSEYWPGEDTKFCLDLVQKTGRKILYDPCLVAYHHRRRGLGSHLRQVCGYGLHRGFFARRFPETSRKLKFFLPSFFLLYLLIGIAGSFANGTAAVIFAAGLFLYGLALVKATIDIARYERDPLVIGNAVYYIIATHITYGWFFLKGLLFTRVLKSRLR